MKKLFCLIALLTTFVATVNAQGLPSVDKENQLKSSVDFSYLGIENAFGLGYTMILNHLAINASFISGDTGSYVTKNEGWRVGLGGNYRYWLTNFLYAEGQAGIEYSHATLEYKVKGSKTEESSEGNVGMFLTPRLGVRLFTLWNINWGVTAGYRWDFNKFKFDKEHTADYFTIGISAVM